MTVFFRAISIPDASAFIEIDGRLRLLQPPYTKASSPELTNADLEDAIKRSAYQTDDKSFVSITEAINFLCDEHRKWAKKIGLPTQGEISVNELLQDASPALASELIDKIEEILLKEERCDNGEMLLAGIIETFGDNEQLQLRAGRLLAKIEMQKNRVGSWKPIHTKDKRFDTLQEAKDQNRVNEISDRIRKRRCILELC